MQDSSTSSSAIWVAWHVLLALPKRLWDAYVTHLLFYQPQSLVGRLASTFRILAVILILPVVLLTLLDVSAYVIARTLGVVDVVKASTTDADTDAPCHHRTACTCPLRGVDVDVPGLMSNRDKDDARTHAATQPHRKEDRVQACYFAGEGALRLAGEGVFSPAASGPPSPVTPRPPPLGFLPDTLGDAEGSALRRRVQAREDEPGRS